MWAQWLSTNSCCLPGWATPPAASALCSWTAHAGRRFLLLCPNAALRWLKHRIKTRHSKQSLCPPLGSRMTLLFPPHSNVCLWKMSPFSNSSLSVKEPSSAGEIQLYQGIQPPCAFKAAGGAGWPQWTPRTSLSTSHRPSIALCEGAEPRRMFVCACCFQVLGKETVCLKTYASKGRQLWMQILRCSVTWSLSFLSCQKENDIYRWGIVNIR